MDSASACAPAGTNAMLEEPRDHSAPGPVRVPFKATLPEPSTDNEPREASVLPLSAVTVAAPVGGAPPWRSGISQLRSDTASNPGVLPVAPERVTDYMLGANAGAVPVAAEVVCSVAPLWTSMP